MPASFWHGMILKHWVADQIFKCLYVQAGREESVMEGAGNACSFQGFPSMRCVAKICGLPIVADWGIITRKASKGQLRAILRGIAPLHKTRVAPPAEHKVRGEQRQGGACFRI